MKPRPEGPRKYRWDSTGSRKPRATWAVALHPRDGPTVIAPNPDAAALDVERSPKKPPVFRPVTRSPRTPADTRANLPTADSAWTYRPVSTRRASSTDTLVVSLVI